MKKLMYLYDWLSGEGFRVLKDDGFLLAYVGTYWKPEVMEKLNRNFAYYFDFILVNRGNSPLMWQRKVISRHKSIMAYRKRTSQSHPRTNVLSLWVGGGEDKRFHTWGQDESSARYYIDCFSARGETVFDPFCGGGTTAAVCKVLDRKVITMDTDENALKRTISRLKETQPIMHIEDCTQKEQSVMKLDTGTPSHPEAAPANEEY
jgi:site-specific DNA-methyltransferase (adenine-specific)